MRFLAKIALKLFLLLQNATYWYSLRIQVFRCLYGKQLPVQNYINRILLLRQSKLFYLLLSLCFVFTVPCGLQQYIYIKIRGWGSSLNKFFVTESTSLPMSFLFLSLTIHILTFICPLRQPILQVQLLLFWIAIQTQLIFLYPYFN